MVPSGYKHVVKTRCNASASTDTLRIRDPNGLNLQHQHNIRDETLMTDGFSAFLETVFYTLLETDVAVLASSSIFSSEKCQVPGGSLIFGRQPGEFVDPGWPGESRPLTHVETGQEMVSTNVLPEGLFVKLNAIIEQDLSKQRLHQVKSVPYEGQTSGIFL